MRAARIAFFAVVLFLVSCFPWTGNAAAGIPLPQPVISDPAAGPTGQVPAL